MTATVPHPTRCRAVMTDPAGNRLMECLDDEGHGGPHWSGESTWELAVGSGAAYRPSTVPTGGKRRYRVVARETWWTEYEVDADTAEEARRKVRDLSPLFGGAVETDNDEDGFDARLRDYGVIDRTVARAKRKDG